MSEIIKIKNLSKTFKVKIKGKAFKESIKSIFKPRYKEVKTEILWSSLGGKCLVKDITKSIKSGSVVYNLTRPINYILYNLFSHLGLVLTRLILYFTLGLITGYVF